MSVDRAFVDTNVLIYAHDSTAGDKHERARRILEDLWESRTGFLSVQVLQEFFVNVTRKIPKPLSTSEAKEVIADLSRWRVHVPAPDDVLGAIGVHVQTSISFWDAMVIRSAAEMGCDVLYSEDLNDGQSYAGVLVKNPFRDEPG